MLQAFPWTLCRWGRIVVRIPPRRVRCTLIFRGRPARCHILPPAPPQSQMASCCEISHLHCQNQHIMRVMKWYVNAVSTLCQRPWRWHSVDTELSWDSVFIVSSLWNISSVEWTATPFIFIILRSDPPLTQCISIYISLIMDLILIRIR